MDTLFQIIDRRGTVEERWFDITVNSSPAQFSIQDINLLSFDKFQLELLRHRNIILLPRTPDEWTREVRAALNAFNAKRPKATPEAA
ncbi:MAG: hypothetical protein E5Y16_15280 [Mesorhizobium sp.]|nr:MAG: hypothetical protein EOS08_03870 [Mesorhizobium sp.]TJV37480.1 MAG: hypothetical protein E5Y16_15280 [Mesorhizobium sp.]